MIDDATLAEWERNDPWNPQMKEAATEIRRLREESMITLTDGRTFPLGEVADAYEELRIALAAHRAVVRELARFLVEEHRLRNATHYCDHSCLARILLAHPLVQQAREEKG